MRKLLFFALFALHFSLNAQIAIQWSDFQPRTDDSEGILGEVDGHLLAVQYENKVPYLSSFNSDNLAFEGLTQLSVGPSAKVGGKVKTFTLEEAKKRKDTEKFAEYRFQTAYIIQKQLVLFYYSKKDKVYTIYSQVYGLDGTVVKPMQQMAKFPDKQSSILIGRSSDSTLVYMLNRPKMDKDEAPKFFVTTWDNNLEKLGDIEVEMPYKNRDFDIFDTYLTPDQKLITLTRLYIPKNERGPDDPKYQFKLISIDIAKQEVQEYELGLKDMFIRDINLRINSGGKAYCVGVFSKNRSLNSLEGTFYYEIDYKNGKTIAENTQSFSDAIIKKLNNSNSNKKKNSEVRSNIDLHSIVPKPDGGSFVLFEENYIEVVTTRTQNGTTTTYYYNNNDILIMNLDAEGGILWQAVIPKQQESVNDGGRNNSFVATYFKDKLYIFYNDHHLNINPPTFDKAIRPTVSDITMPTAIIMDSEGEYEKEALLSTAELKRDYSVEFRYGRRLAPSRVLIRANKASKGCCSGAKKGATDYRIGTLQIE